MTIAISVKVGEGLVLAADSLQTYGRDVGGQWIVTQGYRHAQKVMQIKDYPIGVLTYGLGTIGQRNLESFIGEFEFDIPAAGTNPGYTVESITTAFHTFLTQKYDAAHPPPAAGTPDTRPFMGVVVGGFSYNSYFPDDFEFSFPGGAPVRVRPDPQAGFGLRWWGDQAPIFRLYFGVDVDLIEWAKDKGVPVADAEALYSELRQRFGWSIIFDSMPIQDAIDLAVYFVNVTIGRSRFAVGSAVCGGHIDVAVITHRGFSWIRRKQWASRTDSVSL